MHRGVLGLCRTVSIRLFGSAASVIAIALRPRGHDRTPPDPVVDIACGHGCWSPARSGPPAHDAHGRGSSAPLRFDYSFRPRASPSDLFQAPLRFFRPISKMTDRRKGPSWALCTSGFDSATVRRETESALPDLNGGRRSPRSARRSDFQAQIVSEWTFDCSRCSQQKSALPDLNGGQVDLQSTALPV